jgi:hypothetical protein
VLVVELGFFSVLSLMVFVLGEWRVTGLDVGGRDFVQRRRMG